MFDNVTGSDLVELLNDVFWDSDPDSFHVIKNFLGHYFLHNPGHPLRVANDYLTIYKLADRAGWMKATRGQARDEYCQVMKEYVEGMK